MEYIFFNQRFTFVSAAGILLIAGAIIFLSLCRKQDSTSTLPARRIFISCIAMLVQGVGQIFLVLPTQFSAEAMLPSIAGSGVIFCTNVVFFAVWCVISGMPEKFMIKKSAVYGLAWGIFAVASYCILLPALHMLGEVRQAGIVFPVGVGVLIVLYTTFTAVCYREKLDWKQKIPFAVIICGIFMSKLG